METKVRKQILLPRGASEYIQKVFNIPKAAVRRAVYFDDQNSGRARMLRAAAMQRGGVLVDADKAYKLTDHTFTLDRESGDMVFTFSENLILTWSRTDHTLTWSMPNDIRGYEEVTELSILHSFLMAAEAEHHGMIKF